jgi:hypothetical protein
LKKIYEDNHADSMGYSDYFDTLRRAEGRAEELKEELNTTSLYTLPVWKTEPESTRLSLSRQNG